MNPASICPECNDSGWRTVGDRVQRCPCRMRQQIAQNFSLSGIPARYAGADLSNFRLAGDQQRFAAAHFVAAQYAERYPVLPDDHPRGLIFTGTIGTGKSHLAVSVMKELMRKGCAARFYDYASLLKDIQSAYRPDSQISEIAMLGPAMEVEVMVLDDLGTVRLSSWVLDTITLLLNCRYREGRTTIITTNYPDQVGGTAMMPTLAERIGERVASRIREMCRPILMEGPDYRTQMRKAA